MPRNWNGQVLRLSFFPTQPIDSAALGSSWEIVAAAPPEIDELRPREGARRQAGPIGDGISLEFHAQPARVDWFILPLTPEGQPPETDFGPFEPALHEFLLRLDPWIESLGKQTWSRAALGSVIVTPVADRTEGYKTILDLVPSLKLDLSQDISDLLYQVNRPRTLSTGMLVNRVMKWTVARAQLFNVAIPSGMPPVQLISKEEYYARLELDINNVPAADSELKAGDLPAIFAAFAEMTLAIAAGGELV